MLCFSDACLSKYSTVPNDLRQQPWCNHLKEGLDATLPAEELHIPVQTLKDLNLDSAVINMIETNYTETVKIFKVNSNTFTVPTFGIGLEFGMIHVKNLECKVSKCKQVKVPHALAKRKEKICIHNLLVLVSGYTQMKRQDACIKSKIDHDKTISVVLKQVKQNFPIMTDRSLQLFLPKCQLFMNSFRYIVVT